MNINPGLHRAQWGRFPANQLGRNQWVPSCQWVARGVSANWSIAPCIRNITPSKGLLWSQSCARLQGLHWSACFIVRPLWCALQWPYPLRIASGRCDLQAGSATWPKARTLWNLDLHIDLTFVWISIIIRWSFVYALQSSVGLRIRCLRVAHMTATCSHHAKQDILDIDLPVHHHGAIVCTFVYAGAHPRGMSNSWSWVTRLRGIGSRNDEIPDQTSGTFA